MEFGFARFRARLTLWWEITARAWWPLAVAAPAVLALMITGWLPQLPWPFHVAALAVCAATIVAGLWVGLRRGRRIQPRDVLKRLEQDNHLEHQPLQTLSDRPTIGDFALWQDNSNRLIAGLGRLKVARANANIRADDPRGLRFMVLAFTAAGLIFFWQGGSDRLSASLSPNIPAAAPPPPTLVDAWISPPQYTGLAPFLVPVEIDNARKPEPAEVAFDAPEQSQLLLQVQGGKHAPGLAIDGASVPFNRASEGAFRHELDIDQDRAVALVQRANRSNSPLLAELTARALEDFAPSVEHIELPRTTEAGSLRIQLKAGDDYGLTALGLILQPVDTERQTTALIDAWVTRDLLGGPGQRVVETTEYFDMTPHPFAGEKVSLTLGAEDDLEQRAETDAVELTLPAREFTHPVARQLAALRMQLFNRPDRPQAIAPVLHVLAQSPESYQNRKGIAEAFNEMEATLKQPDIGRSGLLQVIDGLWELARAIDDDPVRRAAEKLRKLEEQLRDALDRGASDEELLALMEQLREAMEEYQQAVIAKKLAEMLESGELNMAPPNQQQPENPFEDLAQQLEEAAREGARKEAEGLLDELREMLENLESAELQLQQGQGGQPGEGQGQGQGNGQGSGNGQSQAMEMIDELSDIMRQQQQQLTRNFQQQGQGQQGTSGTPDNEGALNQEATRRQLGDFMRNLAQQFGEIPQGLADAEGNMRGAVGDLRQGDGAGAVGNQSNALNNLQRGAQDIARMLEEQAAENGEGEGQGKGRGQGQGQGAGEQNQPGNQPGQGQGEGWVPDGGVDPLGRAYSEGRGTEVPQGQIAGSARAIRDELRRRASDPNLSETERTYLGDLLKEFE